MDYRQKSYYSKYRAIKQTYNGYNYDSRLEASRAYELDVMLKAGQIKDWERQYKVELYFYNKAGDIINFRPWKIDFRVHNLDETYTLEEVKGMELPDFKFKRDILTKIWLPDHPDHDLVVLKQANIRRHF